MISNRHSTVINGYAILLYSQSKVHKMCKMVHILVHMYFIWLRLQRTTCSEFMQTRMESVHETKYSQFSWKVKRKKSKNVIFLWNRRTKKCMLEIEKFLWYPKPFPIHCEKKNCILLCSSFSTYHMVKSWSFFNIIIGKWRMIPICLRRTLIG